MAQETATKAQLRRADWKPKRTSYAEYLRVHRNPDMLDHGPLMGLAFRAEPAGLILDGQTAVAIPLRSTGRLYKPEAEQVGGAPLYEVFANLYVVATGSGALDEAGEAMCYNPARAASVTVFQFVKRYGLLVQDEPGFYCCDYSHTLKTPMTPTGLGKPNPVRWILLESLAMRRAIALARALKEVQQTGTSKPVTDLWSQTQDGRYLFDVHDLDLYSNARWDQELRISARYLRELVHKHVRWARMGYSTDWVRMKTRPRAVIGFHYTETFDYGKGLLGNLWAQFARAELPGISLGRTCPACGTTFEPRRSNQVYCSKACGSRLRMELSRRRQTEDSAEFAE